MLIALVLACVVAPVDEARWTGAVSLADAPFVFDGEPTTQCTGRTVAPAGEVDGDGLADLLISGPCDDRNGMFSMVGSVWLVRGGLAPGRYDLATVATLAVHGTEDDQFTGEGAVGVGDLDGDGLDDIAVGTPTYVAGEGGALRFLRGGRTGEVDVDDADGTMWGPLESAPGSGLSMAGDLTGDARPDLVVTGMQAVWLVSDLQFGDRMLETADATLGGFSSVRGNDSIAVEDLDADGTVELVLTGDEPVDGDYEDRAWVFATPLAGEVDATDARSRLDAPPGSGGRLTVSAGGDAEGDGLPDLAFGLPNVDGSPGGAWLVPAPPLGPSDLASVASVSFRPNPDDRLAGSAVRWAGDLDGDGADDLFISVMGNSEGGAEAGASLLFYGPFSGEMEMSSADARFLGETAGDMASGVTPVGDVDGDGTDEFAFSASGHVIDDRGGGSTYLFPAVP